MGYKNWGNIHITSLNYGTLTVKPERRPPATYREPIKIVMGSGSKLESAFTGIHPFFYEC